MLWAAAGPGGVSVCLSCGRAGAVGGGGRRAWRRRSPCARRGEDGRAVRGRRLRLVTSERATEERGATLRPGRACSPPPPAAAGPRTSSPALPCRVEDSPARFATSGNSGVVTAGAESQVQSGPRVRYGESGGGLRQPQLQHSPPPRLGALD